MWVHFNVAAFIAVAFFAGIVKSLDVSSFYGGASNKGPSEAELLELQAKTEVLLDKVDSFATKAWIWSKSHRQVIKAVSGALILGHGGNIDNLEI